jgi:hypothetical protein
MDTKCRYYFFNATIWVLILAGVIFAQVNWMQKIPSNTVRIIVALLLVFPGGALLQLFILRELGWKIISEKEKEAPDSSDKTEDVPYQFAAAFGTFERGLYLILLIAGKPGALFLWLGFKAIAKWGQYEYTSKWKFSKPFNLSLIGELLNIFLAFAGLLLIKGNTKELLAFFTS